MAKVKVQISVDEELLEALDDYCDKNYMNRSWVFSQAAFQLINQQKLIDSMVSLTASIKTAVGNGKLDDDTRKELEAFETLCAMCMRK